MSIIVKNLSLQYADGETLFRDINFSVSTGQKVSVIGNNGVGKSTLLRILSGRIFPSSGEIIIDEQPYFVPQHFGQFDNLTIAGALGIEPKIKALHAILEGDVSSDNFDILSDDWNIEERTLSALSFWRLERFDLLHSMADLSGGEKTKVFLSGISIHEPSVVLMDEPTNHLDNDSRESFYRFLDLLKQTVVIVSHDRKLLNRIETTLELSKNKIEVFGGNYDFYKSQKDEKLRAMQLQLDEKEKSLRLAKKTARETAERRQKQELRGEKRNEKKGVARIMMRTLKDSAENTSSKIRDVQAEKISNLSDELQQLRLDLSDNKQIKFNFEDTDLHTGKILVEAKGINYKYSEDWLWKNPLTFEIRSGDRIAIQGSNGAGKSTLLRLIMGILNPVEGRLKTADFKYVYIDQEYSLLNNELSVYDQIQEFNTRNYSEHELKAILNRFLFRKDTWDRKIVQLSGGEKMKLLFSCLMVNENTPDMFILDEPTNNLDIQSLEVVSSVVGNYKGTVLIISHDKYFIDDIQVNKFIKLF